MRQHRRQRHRRHGAQAKDEQPGRAAMDTQTPTGKLMLTVLGGIAQFEREMMLERQREGVAKAKAAGKYKGRKPLADHFRQETIRLATEGVAKATIARQLNIGEATVYRILAANSKMVA
jgi:DNA invertase Pin-like site-specific DNA recombinase